MKKRKPFLLLILSAIMVISFGILFQMHAAAEMPRYNLLEQQEDIETDITVFDTMRIDHVEKISEYVDPEGPALYADYRDYVSFTDAEEVAYTGYYIQSQKVGTVKFTLVSETTYQSFVVTLHILPVQLSQCQIEGLENKVYNAQEQEQALTLTYQGREVNFESLYSDKVNPGEQTLTLKGSGNFTGEVTLHYVTAMPQAAFRSFQQSKNSIGVKLVDCKVPVCYQLQIKKGTAGWQNYDLKQSLTKAFSSLKFKDSYSFRVRSYVKIDGKNTFGTWSKTVTKKVGLSLNDCKISGIVNKTYSGKAQAQSIKVTYKGKAIKVKIAYSDNKNIGYRYVTLTGTGDFVDSVRVYYYILPKTTKITGLLEKYNEKDNAVNKIAVQYNACDGGVNGYQIAVQAKGSSQWTYYTTSAVKLSFVVKQDKIYSVRVRAFKKWANGTTVYGKWSAAERVFASDKAMACDEFYYTQTGITVYASGVLKGDKVLITVGGKTYTSVATKDAKLYTFKLKIGKQKLGAKMTLKFANKFGQGKIKLSTVVYYAKDIKIGMTKAQLKLVPGFENPEVIKPMLPLTPDYWYFEWPESGICCEVKFDKNNKVASWQLYYL